MADEKRKYAVNGDELYRRYYSTTAPERSYPTTTQVPSLAGLYEQIIQRPSFSYDVGSDPLYQQYKDRYVQQGQTAMRDTMGQAAALTGGYGSSYAQGVGQQTYDRYMQGLTDKIPELYSAAYSRYQDEGNRLMQQYALAKDKEDTEYSRQQSAYQRLYSLIGSTGYEPTDEELAAAGMPREVANRLRSIALMKNPDLGGINSMGMIVNNIAPAPVAAAPAYYGGPTRQKEEEKSTAPMPAINTQKQLDVWLNSQVQANNLSVADARKLSEEFSPYLKKNTGGVKGTTK